MAKEVIKFYANWCGPCKVYGTAFAKVKEELEGDIKFTEINVEEDPENLSGKYKVRGIPHTVILEDGEVIKAESGRLSEEQLKNLILN